VIIAVPVVVEVEAVLAVKESVPVIVGLLLNTILPVPVTVVARVTPPYVTAEDKVVVPFKVTAFAVPTVMALTYGLSSSLKYSKFSSKSASSIEAVLLPSVLGITKLMNYFPMLFVYHCYLS
jgi:hypothetical protein